MDIQIRLMKHLVCLSKRGVTALNAYWEKKQEFEFKLISSTLGSQTPFVFLRERAIAGKIRRHRCLQSSFLHLDVLLGRDEKIDFSDFLQGINLLP
ncbi:hypothetical protein MXB_4651 [Myxobolus squamalis]|nr:hypothetical protein MXB_4651 [Myxobolus squamalis]